MEAGDYNFAKPNNALPRTMLTTAWDGDWESFKQKFEVTADLNGLTEAVMVGQLIAEDKVDWPLVPTKTEISDECASGKIQQRFDENTEFATENETYTRRAAIQSHKLASTLVLSLIDSTGIQKSIVGGKLRHTKDGVRASADFIMHFEMSSKDLRVEKLKKKWDDAVLGAGEHPDQLWTELTSINQNLKKLGEEYKTSQLMRRFIAGINAQPGHPYKQVLILYKSSFITGAPINIHQLRELLSDTYHEEKVAGSRESKYMKGFLVFKVCEVCNKKGHTKEDCWVKHPDKKPKGANKNNRYARETVKSRFTCWGCGKSGHTKRECKALSNDNAQGIAAAIASTPSTSDKSIYIDSACSCHLMADITHLDPKTIARTTETITAIGGQKILLTQKGTAKIPTADGVLTLTNTYYAQGVEFGLVSVPQLVQRGVSVYLTKEQAYLEKNGMKI